MKKNIGNVDKIIRIILGLAIIGGGYATGTWWGIIGIIPLSTALLGFCPFYPIIHINTSGK